MIAFGKCLSFQKNGVMLGIYVKIHGCNPFWNTHIFNPKEQTKKHGPQTTLHSMEIMYLPTFHYISP